MTESSTTAAEAVTRIWQGVLGSPSPRPTDNFFMLGGESTAAAAIVVRLRERLGVDLQLRDLFEAGTLDRLIRRVEQAPPLPVPERYPVGVADRSRPIRASIVQEWQYLLGLEQSQESTAPFLVHFAVRISGVLNIEWLRHALGLVSARHELLRTGFRQLGNRVYQHIDPDAAIPLRIVTVDPADQTPEDTARRLIAIESATQFDRTIAPLVRCTLFQLGHDDHLLLLVLDHLVCDGMSLSMLLADIGAAYDGLTADPGFRLPKLPRQFADWSQWQRERLSGAGFETICQFWRARLGQDPDIITTPLLHYRTPGEERPERLVTILDEATTKTVRAAAAERGVTLFSFMLAAFLTTLRERTEHSDFCVVTAVANRDTVDTEQVCGPLAHDIYLRVGPWGGADLIQLAERIQDTATEAIRHSLVPNTMLWSQLWSADTVELLTKPTFYFTLNKPWLGDFTLTGTTSGLFDPEPGVPMPGLECTVIDAPVHLVVEIASLAGSFPDGYVQELIDDVIAVLHAETGPSS